MVDVNRRLHSKPRPQGQCIMKKRPASEGRGCDGRRLRCAALCRGFARLGDPRLISLIRRWLKASILEDGEVHANEEGTPQGGSISVLLSNVYLHYVLDLWFERVVKPRLRGEAYLVRYIDDFVICFQYRADA